MIKHLPRKGILLAIRHYSTVCSPRPVRAASVRVSNNIALLGDAKEGPKPRQHLSLPAFPANLHHPLPGKSCGQQGQPACVTVITWLKYYFDDIPGSVIQSHFNKGLDSTIMVLNKSPRLPVKGNVPVHNSMDALAAAALSFGYKEGPKLVHRLEKESSGILLMGRTKESVKRLQSLFSDTSEVKSPSKVMLDDGKTERVIIARPSGIEASEDAITEYRVLGPTINGCSWMELCPFTGRKHQLRVHCAEALGTPIVGNYKYGWFVHSKWKQMPRVDIEPTSGKPYRLRRPEGLDVQKGCIMSKVPLLHLHYRELVIPDIAKCSSKPDTLRIMASMPSHMKISWNLMSSYLI